MKPIIFNDGIDEIEVGLSVSKSYVTITECTVTTYISAESIDKLIEALHLVKKELEDV